MRRAGPRLEFEFVLIVVLLVCVIVLILSPRRAHAYEVRPDGDCVITYHNGERFEQGDFVRTTVNQQRLQRGQRLYCFEAGVLYPALDGSGRWIVIEKDVK